MEMVVSEPPKKRERDWSSLLPELLERIEAKLEKEYADEVRFRAVCKNWRSAPRAPVDDVLPPRLPWLCLPAEKSANSVWYTSTCRFYSLSSEKYHTFKPHGPSKMIYEIPFDGRFIFTATRNRVTLLNPITAFRITLPSLPKRAVVIRSASYFKCQDGDGAGEYCVIALGLMRTKKFYVYRSVDGCWNEFSDERSSRASNVAYYKGSVIFAMGISGCMISYDTHTHNVTPISTYGSTDMSADWDKHLLVQSSSGELLMVKFRSSGMEYVLEVFQLVLTEQEPPKWSRVGSIGNDAIFMVCSRAICIDARGIDGCRSNCIYFIVFCPLTEVGPDYVIQEDEGHIRYFYHVYLFDIKDERVEKVSNSPHEATSPHICWIIPHARVR